jgi:hypothetical protein
VRTAELVAVDALASVRNCKTPEFRFRALPTGGASEMELVLT